MAGRGGPTYQCTAMTKQEGTPQPERSLAQFEADVQTGIAAQQAQMHGDPKEEFMRVVTGADRAPADPVPSEIDTAVFGDAGTTVQQLLEQYRKWTKRVYPVDTFATHAERRYWRRAFIEKFGDEGSVMMRHLDTMNKYKIAATGGLWTLLDALTMRLESGDVDDRALATRMMETFSERAYRNMYEGYEQLTRQEKRAANTAFGRKLAEVFALLAEEAAVRAQRMRKIA